MKRSSGYNAARFARPVSDGRNTSWEGSAGLRPAPRRIRGRHCI